jgi:HAD superfamily hydrolase (TIGR01509 family)
MKIPRFIFFDLDGVLIDSEVLKAAAHVEVSMALANASRKIEDYVAVMGQSQRSVTLHFLRGSPVTEDLLQDYDRRFWRVFTASLSSSLKPAPGAASLLTSLKASGIGTAVVTTSPRAVAERALATVGLAQFIDFLVCAEDVVRHKPDPAPYLEALKRSNASANESIGIEDTDAGVASAYQAGLAVVAMRHRLNSGHSLLQAAHRIDQLGELPSLWS